jgi:protein-S-isoprenylcysteine O-methyltransferase Ste14
LRPELALGLVWLGWVLSWGAAAFWTARTVERPGGQTLYRVLSMLGILLIFGFWRNTVTQFWHPGMAWKWTLVGLAVLGFAFCWWARLHLGRLWSAIVTRKQDHHVVDSGPYALVRHPIYTGIILAGFASALMRGTLIALAGVAVLTLSFYVKARLEEKFLRRELGADVYGAYAARVPMLVPFLKR